MASRLFCFSCLYDFFSRRRFLLFAAFLTILLVSVAALRELDIHQDIQSMLPDDQSEVAEDFRLLQHAPFARKIIINLKGGPAATSRDLIETADRLAGAMTPPFFSRTLSGPPVIPKRELFSWLIRALPNLVTVQDMEKVGAGIHPERVGRQLRDIFRRIISLEGLASKELMRKDPLELHHMALEKLRFLSPVQKARLKNDHFLGGPKGKNILLMADTPIEITDSRGSIELLKHFQDLARATVPHHIKVSLISGHQYAAANAEAVQRDLFIVLGLSFLAILAIFLLHLRSWRALFVFMVPLSAVSIAAVGVSLIYTRVSAITIGFGSVLLGISVDFALHVYYALRHRARNPALVMAEVSRPVLFGGLTSMAAFGVLLFSSLPGQRQLAVFSMVGIGASLLISLVALPHLIRPGPGSLPPVRSRFLQGARLPRKWVLCGWLLFLGLCAWPATCIRFDTDLRSLSLVPAELRHGEEEIRKTWGDVRGRAVIFAQGPNLQSALEANDRLFAYLSQRIPQRQITSLAPIFPSALTQKINSKRWTGFWQREKKERLRTLLAEGGKEQGFSPDAFAPFFAYLSRPPSPIVSADLRALGLGELLDSMVIENEDQVLVLTLVPDTPEIVALFDHPHVMLQGVCLVSQTRFGEIVGKAMVHDFLHFVLRASLVVLCLLGLLFRRPGKVLYALVPVATGLAFMFAVMGLFGIGFNLFNIVAAILIIGLGVDYGIFTVCKLSEGYDHATDRAIFVSGLTTLAGFGALVLARHPALHSIGLSVSLGVCAAIPSALLVIPALYQPNAGRNAPMGKSRR
ncbi:MAG: MMPL family transporter [Deltaproteobacteria bacterium]|nr:MMPL family transporter [Deltaproteobacteria bacterium]